MFQKKIFKIWLPMLIGICLSMIPCNGYASEIVSKGVSIQSPGDASGDAQTGLGETENTDQIELYAEDEKDISQTAFIKSLLSKVGKGYSQSKRYEEDYYDCSSLVLRCLQEFGLTGVPFSTYGWNNKLEGSKIGDIITFHGSGNKVSYKVIAKNTDIISNPDAFAVPGTLMVLIQPDQSNGHIAVSLGEFARQEGEYDPEENPEGVLQTTMGYVTGILSQRYGVGQDLLLGENLITQYPNTWMEKKYLGTDILLDDGTYSGTYNKIWRVEAYSDSTGVCVTNAAKGTNGLNAKYVLLPVTEDANSNSAVYQEKNSIDAITVSNITSEGYQVDVTVTASSGIKQVLMPTWTVADGQDDIVWHKASVNGRVASAKILSSAHKGERGEYITHIYLYSNSGAVIVKDIYIDLTDCSQAVSFAHKHGWEFADGNWYYYNERREKSTGWLKLGDYWYYLAENGEMKTGWLKLGDYWYYLTASGEMKTGWLKLGDTWYYLTESGGMRTGWLKLGDYWYYLTESGAMKTGWLRWGNNWYYFQNDGAMRVSSWYPVDDQWYYFDENGAMCTGWLNLGNQWYYLMPSGNMVTGLQIIDGKDYYFNEDGEWINEELISQ